MANKWITWTDFAHQSVICIKGNHFSGNIGGYLTSQQTIATRPPSGCMSIRRFLPELYLSPPHSLPHPVFSHSDPTSLPLSPHYSILPTLTYPSPSPSLPSTSSIPSPSNTIFGQGFSVTLRARGLSGLSFG